MDVEFLNSHVFFLFILFLILTRGDMQTRGKHSYDLVQGGISKKQGERSRHLKGNNEEKRSENCGERETKGRNLSGI